MHINDRGTQSKWDDISRAWTERARQTGRSPAPRARQLRARARALCTLLARLTKARAEVRAIRLEIEALTIEGSADDAVEETEAARLAA